MTASPAPSPATVPPFGDGVTSSHHNAAVLLDGRGSGHSDPELLPKITHRATPGGIHAPTAPRPAVGATSTRPVHHRPTAGPVGSYPGGAA